jgi:hypothetical protein|tara:strand:+ start:98 stop:445 length:348 start_codon:yes stop_codon:yes gene_type:complete
MIEFMKILTKYLGDFSTVFYSYKEVLLLGMLLLMGNVSVSILHFEPLESFLYPLRRICLKLCRVWKAGVEIRIFSRGSMMYQAMIENPRTSFNLVVFVRAVKGEYPLNTVENILT